MKTFKINKKEYTAKEFDFNTVCDMEDYGFQMDEISTKKTKAIRAYLALCGGISAEEAGIEIQNHILAGGNVAELSEIMVEEMNNSDFFRALSQTEEAEVAADPKKKK